MVDNKQYSFSLSFLKLNMSRGRVNYSNTCFLFIFYCYTTIKTFSKREGAQTNGQTRRQNADNMRVCGGGGHSVGDNTNHRQMCTTEQTSFGYILRLCRFVQKKLSIVSKCTEFVSTLPDS